MSIPFKFIASGLLTAVTLGAGVAAQQPRIENGTVTGQPAGTPFAASFRSLVSSQTGITWIGYAVPVLDRDRTICCFESGASGLRGSATGCCGGCRLETSSGTSSSTRNAPATTASGTVKLEGSDRMVVLFRVAEQKIDRVRVFSEDCQLDAGGRPVQWLENVRPADSIALLESLTDLDGDLKRQIDEDPKGRITDGAITAIALHLDGAADASLERLVASGKPDTVRKKVTFWLGNSRGRRGFDALRRVMRDDPSIEVRKSAIFGLSQSTVPERFDTLVNIARADAEPRLRSEALFWLAQKAGQKVSGAIAERIDQDPDTDVKKKAVFALSQLPKDEGVPLLINVARTNSNIEVRKQAMFWLGQSKDPRAIDFFSEVLGK
jgi:hypothetical protein